MSALNPNMTARFAKPGAAKRETAAERASHEVVARLQRGILRLALAYRGQDAELDGKLKDVGSMIRSRNRDGGLQHLIDDIVETIVKLKIDVASTPAAGGREEDVFAHFVAQLGPVPLDELTSVRERLEQGTRSADLLTEIERAAGALGAHFAHADRESMRGIEDVRKYLSQLIERLPLSPVLAEQRNQLRRQLDAIHAFAEFKPVSTAIADLVLALRQELQREIARLTEFLRSTSRRLAEMEQQLLQSGTLQADSVAAALELSANIDGDFRGLRADVGDADDLNQVKELIETRLDAVERGVARFVANQTTRANEACTAVAQMSVRLKELEQQASSLRENLEAQQTRVMLDPLTGVLNRAGYNEAATKEYARWKRYGGALSLAVIDLDLFKRINDSFGHSAGDRVLATVAARLKEVVRESDILCRYGGEEFVLLLPATPAADALVLLEKLRAHIEHCPFRHRDTPVRVTISAGVAQVAASDTLDSVFERADAALYRAKGAGRNQVVSEFDNTATLANPS